VRRTRATPDFCELLRLPANLFASNRRDTAGSALPRRRAREMDLIRHELAPEVAFSGEPVVSAAA
jgi:hypothetical protein